MTEPTICLHCNNAELVAGLRAELEAARQEIDQQTVVLENSIAIETHEALRAELTEARTAEGRRLVDPWSILNSPEARRHLEALKHFEVGGPTE